MKTDLTITQAAEATGLHPQTIRMWERAGLIMPQRTEGGMRRYDQSLIDDLIHIQQLMRMGMTLGAVQYVLALERHIHDLHEKINSDAQRNKANQKMVNIQSQITYIRYRKGNS